MQKHVQACPEGNPWNLTATATADTFTISGDFWHFISNWYTKQAFFNGVIYSLLLNDMAQHHGVDYFPKIYIGKDYLKAVVEDNGIKVESQINIIYWNVLECFEFSTVTLLNGTPLNPPKICTYTNWSTSSNKYNSSTDLVSIEFSNEDGFIFYLSKYDFKNIEWEFPTLDA